MKQKKSQVQNIKGSYEDNCLEVFMGKEIVWHKEINSAGETIENILLQEIDGGVRGVDIFGQEHFDKFALEKNSLELYQDGKIVKRYAKDNFGSFRPCDEYGAFIYPQKVAHYEPVVTKKVSMYDGNLRAVAKSEMAR